MIGGIVFIVTWFLGFKFMSNTFKYYDSETQTYMYETRGAVARLFRSFLLAIVVTICLAMFGIA